MKNPRHLLILLGFIAQGLTWDSDFFIAGAVLLWIFALTVLRGRIRLSLPGEAIALVAGCAVSILLSRVTHRSMHFFLGDGLLLLQVVRLIRPLTPREKVTSAVIACFHFGVLCTLAPNIRFAVLFIAAIFLIPGALKEIASGRTQEPVRNGLKVRLVPSMRVALWLMLGSTFVFLTFPRFTGSPLQLREGFGDQGSLLDSVLDPRRSGKANSQQVLLQVEGPSIGYLRCFALTEFDGVRWWADTRAKLMLTPWTNKEDLAASKRYLHRTVYVKNSQYLGKVVPVDGFPLYMQQNFFTHPFRNVMSDALECNAMWTTGQNIYEYFVDSEPRQAPMPPDLRRHLLYHPPQTPALKQWLAEATSKGTNALHKSRILELHLRNHFTYKLGSPELSRLAPIDDFIFNRQEGHCERFASAMALFLRMQGIPSRVVVGYVAATRNVFSGRQQARFCDAHSWTEGYFDGLGWVTFDATPGPPPGGGGSDFWDMLEDLDFAWYSYVVNFNGFAQRDLASHSIRFVSHLPPRLWNVVTLGMLVLLGTFAAARAYQKTSKRGATVKAETNAQRAARHFYDEMLNAFSKRGIQKAADRTPNEFLDQLRTESAPGYDEAAAITQGFCDVYYGEKRLSADEYSALKTAVNRIKQASDAADRVPQRS